MRQTGRTTRIVNHIVDQLYCVGECIATDHVYFEFTDLPLKYLETLIEKVRVEIDRLSRGSRIIRVEIISGAIPLAHFKLRVYRHKSEA